MKGKNLNQEHVLWQYEHEWVNYMDHIKVITPKQLCDSPSLCSTTKLPLQLEKLQSLMIPNVSHSWGHSSVHQCLWKQTSKLLQQQMSPVVLLLSSDHPTKMKFCWRRIEMPAKPTSPPICPWDAGSVMWLPQLCSNLIKSVQKGTARGHYLTSKFEMAYELLRSGSIKSPA